MTRRVPPAAVVPAGVVSCQQLVCVHMDVQRVWPCCCSVWSLATGKCVHTLEGHTREVTCVALSPDGTTVVSGSWDATLR